MALVLRQVLDHPVLRPAHPVLLSGDDHQDHTVRWVHTADLYDIAPLLRGGEILLTNGVGLVGIDEAGRRLYVRRLRKAASRACCSRWAERSRRCPPTWWTKPAMSACRASRCSP